MITPKRLLILAFICAIGLGTQSVMESAKENMTSLYAKPVSISDLK